MLFSEKRKFIFIAVPKTGTTAIQKHLLELDPELKKNHLQTADGDWIKVPTHVKAREVRELMGERADEFTFVAFLRNPQDIIASKYHFYRDGRAAKKNRIFSSASIARRINPGTLARVWFAKAMPLSIWARVYPFSSSMDFITCPNGEILIQKVGVTEKLQADVTRIFSSLGYCPDSLMIGIENQTEYDRGKNDMLQTIARQRLPDDYYFFDQASQSKY